jgi:CrcB protein
MSVAPLYPLLAVFVGAGVGAVARWQLALLFNPLWRSLPLGTLIANLVGGYLIGLASIWFVERSGLSPELRLLVITGFLGGLTTFSAFSSEVVTQLFRGQIGWALLTVLLHVTGSLTLTALGMWTGRWLFTS